MTTHFAEGLGDYDDIDEKYTTDADVETFSYAQNIPMPA
jgi:hypothetical protein